jgi:hypothetical protein
MATINQGILDGVSGEVKKVFGGNWIGINYLHVKKVD